MSAELDEFSFGIGTGMKRVPTPPRDREADEALLDRLADMDRARNRGAAEARTAHIYHRRTP